MVISCYIPQIVFCTTLVFVRLSPENLDGYIPFYPIRSLSNQHGHGHLWQRCNERDACLGANNKAEALMRHLCHEKPHDRRAPPLAESHSSSSGFSWEGLQNASQIGGGCAPQEAPSDAPRSVTVKMSPWNLMCFPYPAGGFKHLDYFFHFIYGIIILPIDELHHFSRWLLHQQPDNYGTSPFLKGKSTISMGHVQ